MPATVLAERIGWDRGITVLKQRVAQLRPASLPVDPASRTSYAAGEVAQYDLWFPPIELPVGFGQTRTARQLPVLTMVTGYARWLSATLIPSRRGQDLFAGWWRLIETLGATPRLLVWDGEGAIGKHRPGGSLLTPQCQAFRGTLATKVHVCRPRDPEAKGLIERAHDYLERAFLPGRGFTSPDDFNAQLRDFLALANHRQHRVLGCASRSDRNGPGGHARVAAGAADAHPTCRSRTHIARAIGIRWLAFSIRPPRTRTNIARQSHCTSKSAAEYHLWCSAWDHRRTGLIAYS
jgi:transposase